MKAAAAAAVKAAAAAKVAAAVMEAVMEYVQSKERHSVFRNGFQRLREVDTEVFLYWYTLDVYS